MYIGRPTAYIHIMWYVYRSVYSVYKCNALGIGTASIKIKWKSVSFLWRGHSLCTEKSNIFEKHDRKMSPSKENAQAVSDCLFNLLINRRYFPIKICSCVPLLALIKHVNTNKFIISYLFNCICSSVHVYVYGEKPIFA